MFPDVQMPKPPQTVRCRRCREECSARVVRTAGRFGRWLYTCTNARCDLAYDEVQHRSGPVPYAAKAGG